MISSISINLLITYNPRISKTLPRSSPLNQILIQRLYSLQSRRIYKPFNRIHLILKWLTKLQHLKHQLTVVLQVDLQEIIKLCILIQSTKRGNTSPFKRIQRSISMYRIKDNSTTSNVYIQECEQENHKFQFFVHDHIYCK